MEVYFKAQERGIERTGGGPELVFEKNSERFANQKWQVFEDALLFDGYSNWFVAQGTPLAALSAFSVSVLFSPQGFSHGGDGLFSCCSTDAGEGFALRLERHGRIGVSFGLGREMLFFDSLKERAALYRWNAVTVVFRKEEGWCDLYLNGILVNRKQFRRHQPVVWPEARAYLGKYVDRGAGRQETWAGTFFGLMKRFCLEKDALSDREVKALHASWPVGKRSGWIPLDRSVYENDLQRPQYHLIAPGKWMNEPHGPLWYQGYYHIFYQANPHAPVWDNIQWGHLASADMVHWEDLPPALEPQEQGPDPDGCWSGSALIDKEGCPRIFYSAGNDGEFPNQAVAMARATAKAMVKALPEKGELLAEWEKYPFCVVRQQEGWLGEFRDPFVWLEGDTYYMLVGSGDAQNGGGNAFLFTSPDLTSWKSHGFLVNYDFAANPEVGHVWELPVLLPLRDEKGETACHILTFCACQIESEVVETYGFLGKWDPKGCRFELLQEKPLLLDLGKGTFTGGCGFVTPDNRSVFFTIAQGKRRGEDAYRAGWAHNGGLPVELSFEKGRLCISPVRELASLRGEKLLDLENVSRQEADSLLEKYEKNLLYLHLEAAGESAGICTLYGDREKTILYDRKTARLDVLDESGNRIGRYRGEVDRVELGGEDVILDYYLDHSMIEAYLNRQKSVTLRNYMEKGTGRKLRLAGEIQTVKRLELWEMRPVYGTEA